MEKKGFYTVQSWMLEMPLSLVETVIYAVIYGFSQDGATRYQGSLAYLARMARCSKDTARRALQKLVADGLIEKIEKEINGVTFNDYRCNLQAPLANCEYPPCKMQPHNNIDNNIVLSNDKSLSKTNKRFVPPTYDEVNTYCNERGNDVDAQAFVDFYTSNGWKVGNNPMKDWKAAVRTWEKRDKKKPSKPAPKNQDSYFEHNNRLMAEMLGQNFGGFNDEL
jgi:DNA-binding Lrp family transcriptional regulator